MITEMIKAFFFLLLMLISLPKVQGKSIVVGVVEYPPHINTLNGIITGPAITYMRNVLKKDYESVNFLKLPHKRGILELNKGSIDILFPIKKSEEHQRYLSKSMFHSVPGLCFKKKDFIPFLSSTSQFNGLHVGVPSGINLVKSLMGSKAKITAIYGANAIERSVTLLLSSRIDSFYHPSPINIYHYSNPLSDKIACSYFYGYSTGLYIGLNSAMTKEEVLKIEMNYLTAIENKSYEFYFAETNAVKMDKKQ
jgi:hypothetical protein